MSRKEPEPITLPFHKPPGTPSPAKAKRGLSSEILAMARLDRILDSLDDVEALRVVKWLNEKYGQPARIQGEVPF